MSKHTAGPWSAFTSVRNGVVGTGTVAVEQTRQPVAELAAGPKETVEANARLIAAAPDLLETLKSIQTAVCNAMCPTTWKTTEDRPHRDACKAIRAAIAKAEGK